MTAQITSWQNSKVRLVKRLRSKRGREHEQRFVIEDPRGLLRAQNQGLALDFILYCPQLLGAPPAVRPAAASYTVAPQILQRLGYRENPSGIIAVLHSPRPKSLPELQAAAVDSMLLLVNLQKPGNVGALLRSADAAGFDAVLLVDSAFDLYNPNIIRSSTGACFLGNVYQLDSRAALDFCQARGFQLVAADAAGTTPLYDIDFRQKTAIVLGREDSGLDERWAANCACQVQIPMQGQLADSLNVSVSGAVFMYEVLRQRHFSPSALVRT